MKIPVAAIAVADCGFSQTTTKMFQRDIPGTSGTKGHADVPSPDEISALSSILVEALRANYFVNQLLLHLYRCILNYYPINSQAILWGNSETAPLENEFPLDFLEHFLNTGRST